jgi:hypothetical protein
MKIGHAVATVTVALIALAGCGRRAPVNAIVKGLSEVSAVHLDAEHVYWRGHNAVLRANKDGSDMHSMMQAELTDFVVDTVAIYYTVEGAGVVVSIPLELGGLQRTLANKQAKPGRIALDFVYLYVCNRDAEGSVVKIPKSGGAAEVLADKLPEPQAIALDETTVFFGTSNGQLWRVPKAGRSAAVRLDNDTSVVTDVAVDDGAVYWISNFGPAVKVFKMPKSGGERVELAAFEGESPRLALLGKSAYASYEHDGKVLIEKIDLDGKEKPKSFGGAHGNSGGIGLDASHVFLGVPDPKGDDGWIVRLAR